MRMMASVQAGGLRRGPGSPAPFVSCR